MLPVGSSLQNNGSVAPKIGNVVTNLLPGELEGPRGSWHLELGGTRIERWGTTYGDVAPGEVFVYPGSVGFLEVARRDGDAGAELGVSIGDVVLARRAVDSGGDEA